MTDELNKQLILTDFTRLFHSGKF